MISLLPDFDPECQPIPVIGLIDKYLEHSRIFIFGNGGDERIYISSADLMTRNLDRRIEVACPIYDPELRKELRQLWEIQWNDTSAARIIDNEFTNTQKTPEQGVPFRSQSEFYNYLKNKSLYTTEKATKEIPD
jgi:polyphosphate kinase